MPRAKHQLASQWRRRSAVGVTVDGLFRNFISFSFSFLFSSSYFSFFSLLSSLLGCWWSDNEDVPCLQATCKMRFNIQQIRLILYLSVRSIGTGDLDVFDSDLLDAKEVRTPGGLSQSRCFPSSPHLCVCTLYVRSTHRYKITKPRSSLDRRMYVCIHGDPLKIVGGGSFEQRHLPERMLGRYCLGRITTYSRISCWERKENMGKPCHHLSMQ
ncbi:hypothetical protein SODALDRAFT_108340 [Sodiomyces alkalinus F11]|uniref:Uncharacterized protein n=1 Tax=Sodiomyces alkalinus (strain CBS 110278 / VKM F-3762 / F11) TaxID=1314773 RepID=A0A3N2Q2I6_SODAK|nr:hypothetical protein SODALDRAFT_108340 [Sodiomyces alkalinus F11]ROT40942.1 hypothetical protein SODALDRAFT_108340 [Sodiomyces alkalinus F11]